MVVGFPRQAFQDLAIEANPDLSGPPASARKEPVVKAGSAPKARPIRRKSEAGDEDQVDVGDGRGGGGVGKRLADIPARDFHGPRVFNVKKIEPGAVAGIAGFGGKATAFPAGLMVAVIKEIIPPGCAPPYQDRGAVQSPPVGVVGKTVGHALDAG